MRSFEPGGALAVPLCSVIFIDRAGISEDGTVMLHDTRDLPPRRGVGALSVNAEITSVQYHPFMDHIFVMSDARGNCDLWDTRMIFGHWNL